MATAGILLAAGLSTRMGRPKALLPWCGSVLAEYQVRQMLEAGLDPVVVVVGHEAANVTASLRELAVKVALNREYAAGRATSVRAGALAVPDRTDAILLLNVDQPRHVETLRRLIEGHVDLGGLITVPAFKGKRGHPVVIAGSLLAELRCVSDETEGLHAVTRRHAAGRKVIEVGTMEVLLDLNDPAAYRSALATWLA